MAESMNYSKSNSLILFSGQVGTESNYLEQMTATGTKSRAAVLAPQSSKTTKILGRTYRESGSYLGPTSQRDSLALSRVLLQESDLANQQKSSSRRGVGLKNYNSAQSRTNADADKRASSSKVTQIKFHPTNQSSALALNRTGIDKADATALSIDGCHNHASDEHDRQALVVQDRRFEQRRSSDKGKVVGSSFKPQINKSKYI